jgi:hypothetical protein
MRNLNRLLFTTVPAAALLGVGPALLAQGPNLIQNGSFESGGLAPWTVVAGSAALAPYGTASLPGPDVATATGGGGLLLRDLGSGVVQQIITPASIPPGASLIVEADLGGGANDWTRLVVVVRDAGGGAMSQHQTDYVTERHRNLEDVHLHRRLTIPVPPLAASFAVRVEFNDRCCSVAAASADRIRAHLVVGPTTPPPVPLATELLVNGGFEAGWRAASPIALDGTGWEGAGSSASAVQPYSNSSGLVPNGLVSCAIGGAAPAPSCGAGAAGNLLVHTGGDSAVVQTLDLRGSTASFAGGNVMLRSSAHLGGIGAEADTARVDVRFRSLLGVLATGQLGPVSAAARNYESVLVRREQTFVVPPNTAFVDVVAVFNDQCCSVSVGSVDNVSVRLEPTAGPGAVSLNQNLLPNASFESGSLLDSPLQLSDPDGWFGAGNGRAAAVQYGAPSLPSPAFALANGLGSIVLRDVGQALLRTDVDLRGSAAAIASGSLSMQGSAWLGGVGNNQDTAEVRFRFVTSTGVPVGAVVSLPPVTAAERQNATTLLQRTSSPFVVPIGAATAICEVVFTDVCCSGAFGLADDVRLVAFSTQQQAGATPYPGTDASRLMLATGVDEIPRSGLGFTVKPATGGQVLRTQVGSPDGSLDGAPVLLALDAFLTGQPPLSGLPDVWVDPFGSALLYNGWTGAAFAPVVVPLAHGGNVQTLTLPNGFAGVSLMLQAVALPPVSVPSPNSLYFATDAHEVRIQ